MKKRTHIWIIKEKDGKHWYTIYTHLFSDTWDPSLLWFYKKSSAVEYCDWFRGSNEMKPVKITIKHAKKLNRKLLLDF